MTTETASLGPLGWVVRTAVWIILVYWGIYALVTPNTNVDSHMYNLARVELAARDGLFDNSLFTSVYHVVFPWTFDAVHLPFLQLGWGYALPSFGCLVGTCYISFAMIRTRFGLEAAWVSVATLLSLTCVVYQGTSTKNDIPILFAVAVWIYAGWRRRLEAKNRHLFWTILAVGFMAGSKTTGLLYGAVLGLWTLWELRQNQRLMVVTTAGLVGACCLFGSVETYVESTRLFGNPLGPPAVMNPLRNQDGLAGGIANLSRFVVRGVYLGPTTFRSSPSSALRLAEAEKSLLAKTGLTDKGTSANFPDARLFLFQSGFEELSGFGPVGTIALAAMMLALFCWRPRELWWQLATAAFAGFALVGLTVAYTDWVNRYLISSYALSAIAVVCFLWGAETPARRVLRVGFTLLAILSASAAPFYSFNRGPAAIIASLNDRERFETCAFPLAGETRVRLRGLREQFPSSRIYFVACNDSVILPILQDAKLRATLVTPPVFMDLVARGNVTLGDLVVEDYPTGATILRRIDSVSAPDVYSDNGVRTQQIYQVLPTDTEPSR